jgi:hypothetical protein
LCPNQPPLERDVLNQQTTTESTAPGSELSVTDELCLPGLCATRFAARVLEDRIPHVLQVRWPTPAEGLEAVLPHAVASTRSHHRQSALLELGDGVLACVELGRGAIAISLAGADAAVLAEAEQWLRTAFPATQSADDTVGVTFWTYGSYGATSTSRSIRVPAWSAIERNYPPAVRRGVAALVDPSFRPAEGGQLVLWHGPPGTGKTYALRALGWAWREWCDLHYVVDPEVLFGERSDYLLEVVLDDEGDEDERWRLLVLEDTGELLAADAKERTGQGLSRLLNLVDGIVGQGLRVLVLVTTNEPLRRLHPAVARAGRCAAQIEFAAFAPEEAAEWLEHAGLTDAVPARRTLSDLFALADGRLAEQDRRPAIGFAGSL